MAQTNKAATFGKCWIFQVHNSKLKVCKLHQHFQVLRIGQTHHLKITHVLLLC